MVNAGVQGALEEAYQALKVLKKALAQADERFHQMKPEVLRKHAWLFEYLTPIEAAQAAFRALRVAVEHGLAIGRAAGKAAADPLLSPVLATCALCGSEFVDGVCGNGHDVETSTDRWREEIGKLLVARHQEQGRKIVPK